MYLSTIASEGLPPRGSLQDRIVCEMLHRMRRRRLAEVSFLGRIMASATVLPEGQYRFLVELLSMEIFQENYTSSNLRFKTNLVKEIRTRRSHGGVDQKRQIDSVRNLEVKEEDLRLLTNAERENYLRRLRKIRLKQASRATSTPTKKDAP